MYVCGPQITSGTPVWTEAAAQILTDALLAKVDQVSALPDILHDFYHHIVNPALVVAHDHVDRKPRYINTLTHSKHGCVQFGPQVVGEYSKRDGIMPESMITELAKQMEAANTPPPPPGGEPKQRPDKACIAYLNAHVVKAQVPISMNMIHTYQHSFAYQHNFAREKRLISFSTVS
jgi:hypothetical protein